MTQSNEAHSEFVHAPAPTPNDMVSEVSSEEASQFFYTNKGSQSNLIQRHDYLTGKQQIQIKIPLMKQPKIVYTRNGQIFVLGGTDFQDKVIGKCYQVVENEIKEIA